MKISVIIPTYNRRHQIGMAIESVLSQENVEIELIVVDDGSSDGTVEWLGEAFPDPRLRVLRNARKKGPAGARNTGILEAKGQLVALLDSDDSFLSGHLAESLDVFTRFPEVGLVFGKALYEQDGQPVDYMGPNFDRKLSRATTKHADQHLRIFCEDYFSHLLEFGCYFNLSTVVVRADAARMLMNEELRIAEDYEFWVRLARKVRFACLNRPQIRYLLHEQNISFENAASAADHAPSQIKAYQFMLAYEGLGSQQISLIHHNIAEVYFNWGYRCRLRRQLKDAVGCHWQSLRYGMRGANCLALAKLLILRLIPF